MPLGFRLRWIIAAAAASVAATACSGSDSPVTPPALQSAALRSQAGPAAHKKCKKSELFVSSFRLGYVAIYCTKGHNQAPIGKITAGIAGPEGADVDAKGNLYITNTNANTVTEYAPGSITPEFTYSGGDLHSPAGVAIDSKQNVYVTNLSPASVVVFPQESNSPSRTMTDVTFPVDVAIDKAGNAYVTTYTSGFNGGEILEYAPGTTTGTNLGIVTKEPGGITIDKAGDIVTADQGLPGVLVFPPGKTQPSKTFAQNTLDPDPVRFAKAEHQVYVGDAVGNAVYVYDYPSGTLVDTITDGIDGPNGVALDPAAPL
jgi:sugar lactone lactonase YvrE